MTRQCFSRQSAVSCLFSAGLIFAGIGVTSAQQPVQRIEITGSNIPRIEGESALPVQIISKEQIERTGASSVEQFLQQLGIALQGNNNTVAASNSGAATGGVSGVSLRGLGSQRTLVLIDGRRVNGGGTITDSTTVDVNQIPAAAIERIEILKDGASAIYGSDAIGGVINFILRKDYKGGEVTVSGGITEKRGGSNVRANALLGWGNFAQDGFNATLMFNGLKEQAIFGRDRGFANRGVFPEFLNDTSSGNTFPANVNDYTASGDSGNPVLAATGSCGGGLFAQSSVLFGSAATCRFDPSPLVTLIPETTQTSFMANLRKKLTAQMEGYAQLSYSYKETRTVIQPVPISDQFNLPNNNPLFNVFPYNNGLFFGGPADGFAFSTIILTAASPFYPTGLFAGNGDLLVRYRAVENGNRDITNISEQPRIVLGLKGTAAGWDYDASFLHTETTLTERVNGGFPILSKILPLLNSGTVNFFGPNTPDVTAQIRATEFRGDAYKTKTSIDSLSAKVSGDLAKLSTGTVALALGVEGRREGFTTTPAAELQQGDVSGYGGNFLPQGKGRNVTAGFAEVSVPVLKSLEVTGAARYDNYEGTGSRTTPKLGVRWQPAQQILLRASAGNGFRAPSLTELYQPQTTGVTAPGLNDPLRCATTGSSNDCGTQFPITLGGNTSLKPEDSRNLSWGFLAEPTRNISFGIDWFYVTLKNPIIFGVTPATILADPATYGSFITRAAPDATCPGCPGRIVNINQTNLNIGKQWVSGLDAQFRFRFSAGEWGDFSLSMNGTRFNKYDYALADGKIISNRGIVSPIVNGAGGVIPVWRHVVALEWKRGPWSVTLQESYQRGYYDLPGTFEDPTCDPANVPPLGCGQRQTNVARYDVYNLFGSYSGWKDTKISYGIRNLSNVSPPYTNAGGQNWFQAGYDPGYADPRGRLFFASVTHKFQ